MNKENKSRGLLFQNNWQFFILFIPSSSAIWKTQNKTKEPCQKSWRKKGGGFHLIVDQIDFNLSKRIKNFFFFFWKRAQCCLLMFSPSIISYLSCFFPHLGKARLFWPFSFTRIITKFIYTKVLQQLTNLVVSYNFFLQT